MKMKRVITIFTLIAIFTMTGCGDEEKDQTNEKKKSDNTQYIRCTGNTMEPTYTEGQLLKGENAKNIAKLERGDVVVLELP